jgi:endonuclease-8
MPEGHTLHRLASDQTELVGHILHVSSPQGRFADAEALDGRRLEDVEAWGKHLLQRFGRAGTVHTHLGMRGITLRSSPPTPPKPQVRLRLATAEVAWDLIAPSTCELLDEAGMDALLRRLGPDPLRPDADVARAMALLRADHRPVGAVLLDQSVVAGVGNVFRAEALHAVRIHPRRPASSLDDRQLAALWETLKTQMSDAVAGRRIVTVGDDGRAVYKEDTCADCGSTVETFTLGGRTAYACGTCQAA